jgi:hypothetical protein
MISKQETCSRKQLMMGPLRLKKRSDHLVLVGDKRPQSTQRAWLTRIGRSESEFERVQKEWYGKLAKEGFRDCEDPGPQRFLKEWHSFKFLGTDPVVRQAAEEYWDDAQGFLRTHKFDRPIERIVWALHCEGKSQREIEKAISKRTSAIRQVQICAILMRLRTLMRRLRSTGKPQEK